MFSDSEDSDMNISGGTLVSLLQRAHDSSSTINVSQGLFNLNFKAETHTQVTPNPR